MGTTQRFGLTTLDAATSLASDGGKFGGADRRTLDRLLAALESHDHLGGERLTNPVGEPTATLLDVGGLIPGGTTYYYRVSYVDRFGLETAASDEVSIATPPRIQAPQPPTLVGQAGGTLQAGVYYYALAVEKDGYSTPIGSPAVLTLQAGLGSIEVTFPALPSGASGFVVWRQGPLDSFYTRLGSFATAFVVDDGSVPPEECPTDPSKLPPLTNRTNSTNSITITVPEPARVSEPGGDVKAWRIYRTVNSGVYQGNALVAEITDTDVSGGLLTEYTDVGNALLAGTPKSVSQTLIPTSVVGAGALGPLLLDDGTGQAWRVVADDDGMLVTRESEDDPPSNSLFLTDSSGTTWELTTSTSGQLSTAVGSAVAGDLVFAYGAGPQLPTSDNTIDYRLGVSTTGTLVTTLI